MIMNNLIDIYIEIFEALLLFEIIYDKEQGEDEEDFFTLTFRS